MSATSSFSIIPTSTPTSSESRSSSTSVTWSPSICSSLSVTYSSTPILTPLPSASAAESAAYITMPSTPTALWTPVLPPTVSQTPTPSKVAQPLVNLGLTVGEMTIIFTVLGILILIGIINSLHYNKKYKAEKMKRLTEIRTNPLHSQVRTILPN